MAGLSTPVKTVVLPWHCEQSPAAGWAGLATLLAVATARGRVWKPVYWPFFTSVVGAMG